MRAHVDERGGGQGDEGAEVRDGEDVDAEYFSLNMSLSLLFGPDATSSATGCRLAVEADDRIGSLGGSGEQDDEQAQCMRSTPLHLSAQ